MTPDSGHEGFLLFSLGPVQEFIAAARTVRDLWSGSYILSWLTAQAMAAAVKQGGDLLHKADLTNPLVRLASLPPGETLEGEDKQRSRLSCLPNTFVAIFKDMDEVRLRAAGKQIEARVNDEWAGIAGKVKAHFEEKWNAFGDWHAEWPAQIANCWDIRIDILPPNSDPVSVARERLGLELNEKEGETLEDRNFRAAMAVLGASAEARKTIRYSPPHELEGETRPKCILCGDRAQMGPRATEGGDAMTVARLFWETAGESLKSDDPRSIWERLRKKDRFCAVALVKRFAWSQYFCEKTGSRLEAKRVWDTASIAALDWMPPELRAAAEKERWSGRWLHWSKPDQDPDEPACPPDIWQKILDAKTQCREQDLPASPPTYYAILQMDGDNMGERFKKAGRKEQSELSGLLSNFALTDIPGIVEKHNGFLVYAGGDDVLALLPTATVLDCANELRRGLAGLVPEDPITASAGIAVVHNMDDLRDGLDAARDAEHQAKHEGGGLKNRFALAIVRRSGAHTLAGAPWTCVEDLQKLVDEFKKGKTDRWSYHLRGEWEELLGRGMPKENTTEAEQFCKIIDAETERLLGRAEPGKCPFDDPKKAKKTWDALVASNEMKTNDGELQTKTLKARNAALTLVQSASFLARGKEE